MLSHDKINVLIEQKKLVCNSKNFEQLKELSNNLAIKLIELNYDDFSKNIKEFSLDNEKIVSLLNSTVLSNKQKVLIIGLITEEVIEKYRIAQKIIEILLQEKVKVSETMVLELMQHNNSKDKLEQNLRLFTKYIPKEHLIHSALEILGKPYSDITKKENNESPIFPNIEINLTLIKALKNVNYILSYSIVNDRIKIRRKT